jgi:hypothetical protein
LSNPPTAPAAPADEEAAEPDLIVKVGTALADSAWVLEELLITRGYSAEIEPPAQDATEVTLVTNMAAGVRLTIAVN